MQSEIPWTWQRSAFNATLTHFSFFQFFQGRANCYYRYFYVIKLQYGGEAKFNCIVSFQAMLLKVIVQHFCMEVGHKHICKHYYNAFNLSTIDFVQQIEK
jgi:hypothetical protein